MRPYAVLLVVRCDMPRAARADSLERLIPAPKVDIDVMRAIEIIGLRVGMVEKFRAFQRRVNLGEQFAHLLIAREFGRKVKLVQLRIIVACAMLAITANNRHQVDRRARDGQNDSRMIAHGKRIFPPFRHNLFQFSGNLRFRFLRHESHVCTCFAGVL